MPSRRQSLRRLARTFQARTDAKADLRFVIGHVTAISSAAGVTTDGNPMVTVDIRGSTQVAPYVVGNSNPPVAIGDYVAVLLTDKAPLILGKIAGIPA